MLTEQDYINAAFILNIEVACIKAVTEVESSGEGFLNGHPKVLFEPHIFWKELRFRGIDPNAHLEGNTDILYIEWGSKPYGKYSEQWGRLERARAINEDAANSSASWGMFQILGKYFFQAGYMALHEFVSDMEKSEAQHLTAFCNLVKYRNLDDELRNKLWAQFAKAYNGQQYKKNAYHIKLEKAYNKYK